MTDFSLLGPRGTPMVELGGERAWRQYTKGEIVCSLQWLDLQAQDPAFPEDGPIPCMVLFHAFRRLNTAAHVIPQRYAYLYGAREGKPTFHFFRGVADACETLGFDRNDKAAQHRMMDLVVEAMPDLIRMPTDQPNALEVQRHRMGIEVTARAGGKTLHSEVI
ncbi:hypothetical protein [Variovorax sp. PAMC26660]|uniref:hypothetical protein n=1 Tax=Variovorax sp. PAMC26660 TaxID=2762322 RepID=UPI00164E3731|nr:hypothetical protein [Variovorax sp. PAMC26660]QNK66078.1 hypothetical protein H7F35_23135 [Variovorax sp. PAMC26660]